MTIGEKLKLLSDHYRLSQSALAEAAGVSQSQVSKWFRNVNTPDVYQAFRMARKLNVPLEFLADDEQNVLASEEARRLEADILEAARDLGYEVARARLRRPSPGELTYGPNRVPAAPDRTRERE
jgi:transcriptional regulator with XRE-family HTH domain